MASTRLSDTMGTPTLGTKFTYSCWIKRGALGAESTMINMYQDGNNAIHLRFDLQDNLSFYVYNSASFPLELETNAVFRDTSAWYHIVAKVDTTQATSSNRCKLYVNGTEQTSLSASTYPSQNATFNANASGSTNYVGGRGDSTGYFDGSMTHVHFTDGYAYDATDFGETDSTSGIWKPKTSPSVTYGSNGFFLKFENSGAMGTDSSGNSNTFTVSGNLTQNVDTASNNFATLNPLFSGTNDATLSNGNLSYTNTNLTWRTALTTLGVTTGKWYFEFKNTANDAGSALRGHLGCVREDDAEETSTEWISDSTTNGTNVGWDWNSGTVRKSAVTQYTGNTVSAGDICSIALDLDNGYIYFGKNGTWENSGDPTSGASGTGGTSLSTSTGKYWFVGYSSYNSCASSANFGQGYFGTTAVVSANADDGGLGIMEYNVPANYRVLCTKNIKDYG